MNTNTDTDTDDSIDRIAIRRAIRETVRSSDEPPTRAECIGVVATTTTASESAVEDELDMLQRNGIVYLVGDDDPEVKLP